VSDVVIRTLRNLPADTRRGFKLVLAAWALLLALQVWDSWGRPGAQGVAELASVVLGTAGILLIGLAEALRRAEEPWKPPPATLGMRAEPVTADSPAVRQVLMALPTLGVLAGGCLAAAVVILIARVWLGTSPAILAVAAFYGAAFVAAVQVVKNAARRLYEYGQREAGRVARAEAQLAGARLAALQAQMNPHFLFNALNTVASLAGRDPRAAEAMVENLSDVLRMTLERSQSANGTLADEVAFVRAYLSVEAQRFGDRLLVEWAIAPETLDASMPPLSIQPLVENALKHGIGPRREGGRVAIRAARDEGRLRVSVIDSGDGFAARFQEGTGLGNLRTRLDVMYGSAASLAIDSTSSGACVTLDVPFQSTGQATHARVDR
jgi:signal transduction histidine kinase